MKQPPYKIISASSIQGTLHTWHPGDTTPRNTQTNCTLPTPNSLIPTTPTGPLLALTQNPSRTTTSLSTYSTTPPTPRPSTRHILPTPLSTSIAYAQNLLAIGSALGDLHLWTLPSGILHASLRPHFRALSYLRFLDDASYLLSAGHDAAIHLFSVPQLLDVTRSHDDPPLPLRTLAFHTLPIVAISVGFAATSARVLSASKDRSARISHLASGECVATILLRASPTCALLTTDERFAYVALQSGDVVVADVCKLPVTAVSDASLPTIPKPDGDECAVSALAVSPFGTEVIVGYSDGIVRVFHAQSRQMLCSFARHAPGVPVDAIVVLPVVEGVVRGDVWQDVVLQKVRDAEALEEAEAVFVADGPDVHDDPDLAWEALEFAFERVFGEGKVDEEPVNHPSNDVSKELLEELDCLRKRNRELEEAGKRLLALVEDGLCDAP